MIEKLKDLLIIAALIVILAVVYDNYISRIVIPTPAPQIAQVTQIVPVTQVILPFVTPTQAPTVVFEPTWTPFVQAPTSVPVSLPEPTQAPAEPVKHGFDAPQGEVGTHDPGPSSRPTRQSAP